MYAKKLLARNYTKKDLEREISTIKIQNKSNRSHREHLLRSLYTSDMYDDYRDMVIDNNFISLKNDDLKINQIDDPDLLTQALKEVITIATNINTKIGDTDELTNYRFYINTPYFNRTGSSSDDPFPLYKWKDNRVNALSEIIEKALTIHGETYNELLNVIVRVYRPADILNFHIDQDNFSDKIYGIILENIDPSRGLILVPEKINKNQMPIMLPERSGLIWCLTNEIRWQWQHGYCSNFKLNDKIIRVSITFRFFRDKKTIPIKEFEP